MKLKSFQKNLLLFGLLFAAACFILYLTQHQATAKKINGKHRAAQLQQQSN